MLKRVYGVLGIRYADDELLRLLNLWQQQADALYLQNENRRFRHNIREVMEALDELKYRLETGERLRGNCYLENVHFKVGLWQQYTNDVVMEKALVMMLGVVLICLIVYKFVNIPLKAFLGLYV